MQTRRVVVQSIYYLPAVAWRKENFSETSHKYHKYKYNITNYISDRYWLNHITFTRGPTDYHSLLYLRKNSPLLSLYYYNTTVNGYTIIALFIRIYLREFTFIKFRFQNLLCVKNNFFWALCRIWVYSLRLSYQSYVERDDIL